MGDEAASNNKTPEMSPTEDGTKVPLTNDAVTVTVEEAKFVSNPNGDAKVAVEIPTTFSGLTKEELMKYSTDPFWVRLRWFLFILFWLGWLAMLVVAVVIIVQAPGCKPPPELLWTEENPMMQVDPAALPTQEALLDSCDKMGLSSVYFPDFLSNNNFQEPNYEAQDLITGITGASKEIVIDLPSAIEPNNHFYANASSENLINSDGTWNYTNEALAPALFHQITNFWMSEGVKGFVMRSADTPEQLKFKDDINALMLEGGGAVGSGNKVDTKNQLSTPSMIRSFLEDHSDSWNFYKYSPVYAAGSTISEENMRLVTIGLFLASGTPAIDGFKGVDNSTLDLVKYLSGMKALSGIKFGNINFVNSTSEDVLAYTRVYKGSPAYAVALNFASSGANVTFEDTENVGSDGKVKLFSKPDSNYYETKDKYDLNFVSLAPYEGVVLEFVAAF